MTENLFGGTWERESDQPGFEIRHRRLAQGELLGAGVWEIAPGMQQVPYHFHRGNEELLVILDGRPTLRTPAGERRLAPGDAILFPRGPEGAHTLLNETGTPVRCLFVSTLLQPEVVEYPDSRKVGVRVGALRPNFRLESEVDYWDGEEARPPR
ncbi:MAG: cupin domain-containing protein [Actinobacteria bacterium]|nr:cupin domain-containing protein [Actinomycetota bacterium]